MDHISEINRKSENPFNTATADMSVMDFMVALRLRATGHSKEEIARILVEYGMAHRPDAHSWDDYAERTVEKAFGMEGDMRLKNLMQFVEQWREIEEVVL